MVRDWITTAYQFFGRILVRSILFFVGSLEIEGQEHIPATGPYIVGVNHLSKVDPPITMLVLPRQRMRVFAADRWRRHLLFGPILALSGAIWVKRGEVDRRALQEAVAALREGQILGMAPEGTRSRTRKLQKARQGASYLADRAKVLILPAAIINSDRLQENILRLRRTQFRFRIGQPFILPDLGHRAKAPELEAFTELIMAHIAQLLPERYRGYYSDSPALAALEAGEDPWPAACQAAGLELPGPCDDTGDGQP